MVVQKLIEAYIDRLLVLVYTKTAMYNTVCCTVNMLQHWIMYSFITVMFYKGKKKTIQHATGEIEG